MADDQTEIISGLARCELFACLTSADLADIAALCAICRYPAGTILCEEGEVGVEMYVLLTGLIEAFTRTSAGEVVLQRLDQTGAHCAELALRPGSDGRRAASVRVVAETRAIVVPKQAFRDALGRDPALEENLSRQADRYASQLSLVERSAMYRALVLFDQEDGWSHEQGFGRGEIIFREGDPGQELYIIQSGTVRVTRASDGQSRLLALLGPGQTFGELAVVGDGRRQATVSADTEVVVRVFDRARFRQAMGRNPEIHHYLRTLRAVYQLESHSVTQFDGELAGKPALVTICRTDAGHEVIASHVLAAQIYDAQAQRSGQDQPQVHRYEDRRRNIVREIAVVGDVLVGVHAVGPWSELGPIHRQLLECRRLDPGLLATFAATGHLIAPAADSGPAATVCHCLAVSRAAVESAITRGHRSLEAVADTTGATTVCGGCTSTVAAMVGNGGQPVRLVDRIDLLPSVSAFRFAPVDAESRLETAALRQALPGQHVVVSARIDGHWVHRPYTITSPADLTQYREIIVKREAHGYFSSWLFGNPSGAELQLSHPKGEFWVDLDRPEPVVFLVAGIGITPALAALRSLVARGAKRPMHVDYSARTERDLAGRSELDRLAAEHDHLSVHYRLTGAGQRLDLRAVRELQKGAFGASYFICGPDQYQRDAREHLTRCGVAADRMHVEVFTPVGHAPQLARPRSREQQLIATATLIVSLLYLVQWLAGWQWRALALLQNGFSWQLSSGLALATLIGWQWLLPAMRLTGRDRAAAAHYRWHRRLGLAAPILLYLHSQIMGYALLFLLASSFLANTIIGAVDKTLLVSAPRRDRYQRPWLAAHVGLSVAVLVLSGWHAWFALAYK